MGRHVFFCLCLLVCFGGCIPSIYPLFSDDELLFEDRLIGIWRTGTETWKFTAGTNNDYILNYAEEEKTSQFAVKLGSIDDQLFLDTFPMELVPLNDFTKAHLIPVHLFIRLSISDSLLHMQYLKPGWIKEQVTGDTDVINHMYINDRLVLTAKTEDLQEFVKNSLPYEQAFTETRTLERIK